MGTYLMMLYVSLEQEKAVRNLFTSKGWGYRKPDLSLTTDKLGPLSVEETDQMEEDEETGRARVKPVPTRREASKRIAASKAVKSSPGPKSAKKSPKVKVRLAKGGKNENAEFQEILEEAELITASINQEEETEEADGDTSIDVKVERESSGDDSDDHLYDDDEEHDNEHDEFDEALEEEAANMEAEPESTDMSQETSTASVSTPRPRKKRKLAGKVKATPGGSDQEAGGDKSVKGKRRSGVKTYTQAAMIDAFNAVKDGRMGVAGAAKVYGIPTQTLRDRVKGRVDLEAEQGGPGPLLTRQEERNLIDFLMNLYNLGYGFTRLDLAAIGTEYAVYLGKRDRSNPVGISWIRKIFDRWTEAKQIDRINKKPLPSLFTYYFDQLEKVMLEHQFDKTPNLIIGITFIEIRQGDTDSSEEQILATVIASASASGQCIPPFFVFPGEKMTVDFMKGALAGSSGVVSADGRMTTEVLIQFLTEHVMRNVPDYKEGQSVLVHVNGAKYCSVGIMELASSLNMLLFFPPAKATGVLQPLDLGCVEPFKELYTAECENHMIQTSTNIAVDNVCALVCKVYQKAFSPSHIANGFSQAGLYPCDRLHVVVKDSEQMANDSKRKKSLGHMIPDF